MTETEWNGQRPPPYVTASGTSERGADTAFSHAWLDASAEDLTVVVTDVATDGRFSEAQRQAWQRLGFSSGIGVSLGQGGRRRAVLSLNNAQPRRWTATERSLFKDVAERLWITIERARAESTLRAMNATLEQYVEDRTQRLADLNSELRTLATASSQELSEPLRRLRGFLQLLERQIAEHLNDKTRRYFSLVQEDAQRAERLAEEFKTLAYLEQRALKPTLIPLTTLVLQVRSDLIPRLMGRTITWSVGDLPVVTGDPILLRQAFTELLYHSLKLIQEGIKAQVAVRTEPGEGSFTVRVTVTPVGADPAELIGGLGVARRVIQRHGGTLEMHLEGERIEILLQLPDQTDGS